MQRSVRPNPTSGDSKASTGSLNTEANASGPWESDKHKVGDSYKIQGDTQKQAIKDTADSKGVVSEVAVNV